ncbi:MAG: tRNA (cytidine(56)-2'-O)-methyltransferase [Candidatus Hodarchaeota archaeon]
MNHSKWRIVVLKINHRPERDKRLTTHVGLTARAFGADEFWISGIKDEKIASKIHEVNSQWGNQAFRVMTGVNWRHSIKTWKEEGGEVIHLTMYGFHVDDVIGEIRGSSRQKLIAVGGPKVPAEMYKAANYNVAVGHQPHSEVAALSIFLDRLFQGSALHHKYSDARIEIVPSSHGKQVKESD